jgi:DNA-binding MarR family transcriptional regulator
VFLPSKLGRFDDIVEKRLRRYLQDHIGLDQHDISVLIAATEEPRSHIAIAKVLHLHPNVMTTIANRLTEAKLLERKPDGKDKRRLLLAPTAQGAKLASQIRRTRHEIRRLVLHPLSEEKINQLEAILDEFLNGNAGAEEAEKRMKELDGLGKRLSKLKTKEARRRSTRVSELERASGTF